MRKKTLGTACIGWAIALLNFSPSLIADELTDAQLDAVVKLEEQRIKAINQVIGSVIAIYGEDRSGGGSGVIIHPSGIALTNHHVIMGAGVEGWGGISDGKMYKWKLIGTDPGGDVSIIQMEGRDDFPWTPLGDSDKVRVGDWALAMGNPFILSEDQSPTVTLGIVSGVNRYQPSAGQNQLEYGNCIQVDSSINPGNSGGPLFNFDGEVVGINGRGSFSFQDRGKVNVGLGYAISSNQIRKFVPELLATKLVEHATLDANFSNRNGKVVCSQLSTDSPAAVAGLKLGDELLEFEGQEILTANQFTNLICTIPEDWPVSLKVRDENGAEKLIRVRAFGLPYPKPQKPKSEKAEKDKSPQEKTQERKQNAMIELLSAPPGQIRYPEINRKYAFLVLSEWRRQHVGEISESGAWKIKSALSSVGDKEGDAVVMEELTVWPDGRFVLQTDGQETYLFDGDAFYLKQEKGVNELTTVEAKTNNRLMSAFGIVAPLMDDPFAALGKTLIDGTDRAVNSVSWRMRIDDADEDATYVWLEINRERGASDTARMLKKIAANRDSTDEGGVQFDEYVAINGLAIPKLRTFVSGLAENVTHRLDCKQMQWLEISPEESMFDSIADEKTEESAAEQTETENSEVGVEELQK